MSLRLLLCLGILCCACATTHHELEVTRDKPVQLPPSYEGHPPVDCQSGKWRTRYEWVETRRKEREVRVSIQCIDRPENDDDRSKAAMKLDGEATLRLTGGAGGAPERRSLISLESLDFSDKDGVVDFRDGHGRLRTVTKVERLEYHDNVVIIRVTGGAGFVVAPAALLGVRWGDGPKKK